MWYKSSSYFFMIFLVVSASFLAFIPFYRNAMKNTEEEYLKSQMKIAQANLIMEKMDRELKDKPCVREADPIFIENLSVDMGKSFLCRSNEDDVFIAVELKNGWYCVDTQGFSNFVIGVSSHENSCTS